MASQWFYQAMGKSVGPVSSAQLQNLAQRGTITIETPVANAPNGPWVPAARVKGLFAVPNGTPPATAATRTTQIPSPDTTASEERAGLSAATKVVMGMCGTVSVMALGFLVWFIASRDTWELHNSGRISAKLEEANRLQQSDFVAAYNAYDEVLKEAKQHKVKDEQLVRKLTDAENSRMALSSKVQEKAASRASREAAPGR